MLVTEFIESISQEYSENEQDLLVQSWLCQQPDDFNDPAAFLLVCRHRACLFAQNEIDMYRRAMTQSIEQGKRLHLPRETAQLLLDWSEMEYSLGETERGLELLRLAAMLVHPASSIGHQAWEAYISAEKAATAIEGDLSTSNGEIFYLAACKRFECEPDSNLISQPETDS